MQSILSITDFVSFYSLGDVINKWRVQDLDLEPLSASDGPDIVEILKIPYTYCWSPSLVAKPNDWGPNIGKASQLDRDYDTLTTTIRYLRLLLARRTTLYAFGRSGTLPAFK